MEIRKRLQLSEPNSFKSLALLREPRDGARAGAWRKPGRQKFFSRLSAVTH